MIDDSLPYPAVRKVFAELEELGSAQAIANFFAKQDVVGMRGVVSVCPLAQYARRKTGEPVCVSVKSWYVKNDGELVVSQLSSTVESFRRDFDAGIFPRLDSQKR